eukprot:Colp12_sorted_trinity150504_noHs@46
MKKSVLFLALVCLSSAFAQDGIDSVCEQLTRDAFAACASCPAVKSSFACHGLMQEMRSDPCVSRVVAEYEKLFAYAAGCMNDVEGNAPVAPEATVEDPEGFELGSPLGPFEGEAALAESGEAFQEEPQAADEQEAEAVVDAGAVPEQFDAMRAEAAAAETAGSSGSINVGLVASATSVSVVVVLAAIGGLLYYRQRKGQRLHRMFEMSEIFAQSHASTLDVSLHQLHKNELEA